MQKHNLGDTRTADRMPTIKEFKTANHNHRANVSLIMSRFGHALSVRGVSHDWTKAEEPYKSAFYQAMTLTMEAGKDFNETDWAMIHYARERHHLNRFVPPDVNLIDVIEMICDCCEAAAARSGEIRYLIELPNEVLQKAVQNTVAMVWDSLDIRGWEPGEGEEADHERESEV